MTMIYLIVGVFIMWAVVSFIWGTGIALTGRTREIRAEDVLGIVICGTCCLIFTVCLLYICFLLGRWFMGLI